MIYQLSRQASATIDDIIRYTDEKFGPDQTAEYVGGLYTSFEICADNPRIGRTWHHERRVYIYRSHYVFYRTMDDRVFITDILNTRQKIPREWERD